MELIYSGGNKYKKRTYKFLVDLTGFHSCVPFFFVPTQLTKVHIFLFILSSSTSVNPCWKKKKERQKEKNMKGETNSLNYSSESRRSWDSISILVVDDDTTCLSIVAAILKKFKYEGMVLYVWDFECLLIV